jgi:hypothetical protein
VAGNRGGGVSLSGDSARGNRVEGNFIRTDATARFGINTRAFGVDVFAAASNIVGGAAAGEGNVIAASGLNGIRLYRSNAVRNGIAGNLVGLDATGRMHSQRPGWQSPGRHGELDFRKPVRWDIRRYRHARQ